MKLKKIASLMLAGIMAVSMLAACGEGNTINENPGSSSEVPSTSAVVSTVSSVLKTQKSNLTVDVKESPFLNDRLDEIIAKHTLKDIKSGDYVEDGVNAAFGVTSTPGAMDLATNGLNFTNNTYLDTVNFDSQDFWVYAVIDNGDVSATENQILAAKYIADKLNAMNAKDEIVVAADEVYNMDATLYVAQRDVTDVGDKDVPVVFAVLKLSIAQKAI